MTADEFRHKAVRRETDTTITYDVRSFGDQQQEAVAVLLGELVFRLSINALKSTKSLVISTDERFQRTPQLDGFIQKLDDEGLSIRIDQA